MESISTYKSAVSVGGKATLIDIETRPLNDDEILIKVMAAPINPSDKVFCRGLYGVLELQSNPPEGKGLGFEASGEVVDAGEGAKDMVGKKVAFSQDPHTPEYVGTWKQYMYLSKDKVIVFPDDSDYDTIASNFINPFTVWGFVDIYNKTKCDAILHNPASSAVGRMLVKYANKLDIPVINVVRKQEHVDMLTALGATIILNSSSESYAADLKETLSKYTKVAFYDAVGGGEPTTQIIDALPPKSTGYIYGVLGGAPVMYNGGNMIFFEKTISSFWVPKWFGSITLEEKKYWSEQVVSDLKLSDEESCFKTKIAETFPLTKISDAWRQATKIASEGKVILRPHDE